MRAGLCCQQKCLQTIIEGRAKQLRVVEGVLKRHEFTTKYLGEPLPNSSKGSRRTYYKRIFTGPATKHDKHRERLAMQRRDGGLPRRRLLEARSDAL